MTVNYDKMNDLIDLGRDFVGPYKRLIDYTRIIESRFDWSPDRRSMDIIR